MTESDTSEGVTKSFNLGYFDFTGETHIERTYTVSGKENVKYILDGVTYYVENEINYLKGKLIYVWRLIKKTE